jgi:hypothetical protein
MNLDRIITLRRIFIGAILFYFGIGLALDGEMPTIARGAQSAARKTGKPDGDTHGELVMPFRIGEKLEYRVAWASLANAGLLELSVAERRDLLGWGTWHFRATAHTSSLMRVLMAVDDQFDSYTDTATLESRQYETYLNEMGTKQNQILHFVQEGQKSRGNFAGIVVSPGTRDPLGASYVLRGVDWQRTKEFRMPVFDGEDLYELRARVDIPSETVAVDAGTFQAAKISIHLFQREREVSGMKFFAWLANDGRRTPVLLEAEMPMGNFRVELVSAVQ